MRLVKAFGSVNAVAELMVYEKRTCTTCKNLAVLLEERGIDFDRVDFHVEPLTADEIRELVKKTGQPARELFRAREPVYSELGLEDGEVVELERRTKITRLGQDVDATGTLADEAMDRVAETIAGYREVIDRI